jgi:trimeric autotransporter adhesin
VSPPDGSNRSTADPSAYEQRVTFDALNTGAMDHSLDTDPATIQMLADAADSAAKLGQEASASRKHRSSLVKFVLMSLVLLLGFAIILIRHNAIRIQQPSSQSDASQRYSTTTIPLADIAANSSALHVQNPQTLSINGQLNVNNSLVLVPSSQPSNPLTGQLYYNQAANQLSYYNGSQFVNLLSGAQYVNTIGGASGSVAAGPGLAVNGNTLSNSGVLTLQGESGNVTLASGPGIVLSGTTVSNSGVLSIGGQNGNIQLGNGLSLNGNTLNAQTGVESLAAATNNVTVTDTGNGNWTIGVSVAGGAGAGTVASSGGTVGKLAYFAGVQDIENSLISQSGGAITVAGNLDVTGNTTLGSPLTVGNGGTGATTGAGARTNLGAAASGANSDITSLSGLTTALSVLQGGTGAASLTANGVLIGNGTSPVTGATGSNGQCLMVVSGTPAFGTCPGSGSSPVTSLDGLTGVLTINNSTGSGTTVTINNAKADGLTKGIATFNSSNFTDNGSGVINTVQNISTSASPSFAGLSLGSPLTVGNGGTGATTGAGARTNLGAAASGANSDITSLSGLTTALSVVQGGTGLSTLTANQLLFASSSTSVSQLANGASGLCLMSNGVSSAPSFQTCTGAGGVSSIDGLSGAVTLANSTGAGSTVTISNAAADGLTKGIATFNSSNFSAAGGVINTIQDINTGASPTFANITVTTVVNTNTITPSSGLTIGATGQSFTLQGSAASTITATGGSHTTTVGFTGTPSANVSYQFDRSVAAGTYTICTTIGNCAGTGGGITGSGLTNKVAVFTSTGSIGSSDITDNGTTVSVGSGVSFLSQGQSTFAASTNSSTAFQVQNASGNSIILGSTVTSNLVATSTLTSSTATNWSAKGGGSTVTGDPTSPYENLASIKAAVTSANSGMQTSNFSAAITTSTQYQLTFYAKCNITINSFTYGHQDISGTDINATTAATCNSTWQQYTFHFTTGSTVTSPDIYMDSGTTSSVSIWVDGISLVQTTSTGATNYAPGTLYLNAVVANPAIFQNSANSTTAFQVQNANGADLLAIDTTDNSINLGTNTNLILSGTSAYISNPQGQTHAEAFGATASVGASSATAVGYGATAVGTFTVSLGNGASAANTDSIAIGSSASSYSTDGISIGYSAAANTQSIAIGTNAAANSSDGTAIGYGAVASTNGATLGANATSGNTGVAVGSSASSSGNNAIAIGGSSNSVSNSVAVGTSASSYGTSAVSIGTSSSAANSAVAVGASAGAFYTGSVAIGANAATVGNNQFVVGGSTSSGNYIQNAYIGSGVTDSTPQNVTLHATGGSGANISGANLNLAGGQGTGNANGGNINLQIATPGGSGSSNNSLTTVASINGSNGAATFENSVNSTSAFQIQNASGTALFTIDTSNSQITAGSGTILPPGAVQEWDATNTNLATLSVTPHFVGDLMILAVMIRSTSSSVQSVSGGGVSTWHNVTGYTSAANGVRTEIWEGKATSTGSTNITTTYSSTPGNSVELAAQEFNDSLGATTNWLVIASGTDDNASSTTTTYPSLTATQSGQLYWGFTYAANTASSGSTTGFSYALTGRPDVIAYNTNLTANNTYAPTAAQSPAGTSTGVGVIIAASATSSVTVYGTETIAGTNSSTAFQVQNASGISLFSVDTSGSNVNLSSTNTNISGTINIGTSAGSGALVNNGATVNTTLALGNFGSGGSIGSAASTVDIYTSISVAQTSAAQTLTIPAPTAGTAYGKLLYMSNIGTADFTIGSTTIPLRAGATTTLIWSNTNGGASWQFAGTDASSILNQNSTTQSANFKINGDGTANTFTSPTFQSATDLILQSTGSSRTITIGSSHGETISIGGSSNVVRAIGIGNTAGSQAQTITIGNNATSTSTTTVQGANGVTLQTNSSSAGVVVQSTTNSATAFQVQNSSGTTILNVNTLTNAVGTASVSTASTNSQSFVIQSGNATGTTSTAGNVTIDVGTSTTSNGSILIGNAGRAQTITLGSSAQSDTISLQTSSTLQAISTNFNLSTAGVVTLAGNQTNDITTAAAATATSLTIGPGSSSSNSGTGASVTIQGGNETGTTSTGGNISLDAGTGTTNGSVNIGTSNASGITIGKNGNNPSVNFKVGNGTINLAVNGGGSVNSTVNIESSGGAGSVYTFNAGTVTTGQSVVAIGASGGASTSSKLTLQSVGIAEVLTNGSDTIKTSTNSATAFQVQNSSSVSLFTVDTVNSRIIVGSGSTGDTTGFILVTDSKTTSGDPTGVNGAIYYQTGGTGGPAGTSTGEGVFRCYQGGEWMNCIGTPDVSQRRWGYAAPAGNASTLTPFGLLGALTQNGGASDTTQAESNYVNYTTAATNASAAGITLSNATTEAQWLPKMVARVRTPSSIAAMRDWVGLTNATLTGTDGGAQSYVALRYDTNVGGTGTAWVCASGDGATTSTTSTGVAVAINTYYDIILDLSTAGTLVCSVSANGGAFTSVTKTTNLPVSTAGLFPEVSITTLQNSAESLEVEYYYVDQQ